jgi:tetratricopeptide (TPR) repeat protein
MHDERRGVSYGLVLLMVGMLVTIPAWASTQASDKKSRPPEPAPSTSSSNRVTQCDILAADPYDSKRRAPGVSRDDLKATQAVKACTLALQESPNDPVLEYQLARALEKSERYEEAIKYLTSAGEKQYPQAFCAFGEASLHADEMRYAVRLFERGAQLGAGHCQYAMGVMYQFGLSSGNVNLVRKDYTKARYWFEKAEKTGHPKAKKALVQLANQRVGDAMEAVEILLGGGGTGTSGSTQEDQGQIEFGKTQRDRGVPGYQGPLGAPQ